MLIFAKKNILENGPFAEARSADPHDPPLIDLKHFSNPEDLAACVQGYRRMMAILTHPNMTKHWDPTGVVPLPPADAPTAELLGSEPSWEVLKP
eukprot:Skav231393  [mRNA]  locus=scaffold1456:38454:42954:- [translate_table: standard]